VPRRFTLSPQQLEHARIRYLAGGGLRAIARELGVGDTVLSNALRAAGVPMRTGGGTMPAVERARQEALDAACRRATMIRLALYDRHRELRLARG
jgi:hypothetical protein